MTSVIILTACVPLVAISASIFTFGFIESLVYAICDAVDKPPTFVGVIVSVQGIGALAGGLLSSRLIIRLGHVRAIVIALFLFTVSLTTMVVAPTIEVLVLGVIPLGFGLPLAVVAISTLIRTRTPNRLTGRVSTTSDAMVGTPRVIAIAVGSALVVLVDYHVMLAAMAAAMLLIAVALGVWARRAKADSRIQADARAALSEGEPRRAA